MFQLNSNATYCINRAGVASLSLGVNSLGHVNDPICWAIIPKKTEGQKTYAEKWFCVQDAAINTLNQYKCSNLPNCETCFMVTDLRSSQSVQKLMNIKSFDAGRFEVDATMSLCDHLRDFHVFTQEVFTSKPTTGTITFLEYKLPITHNANTSSRSRSMTSFMMSWFEFRRSVSKLPATKHMIWLKNSW
jgi:hypothetical protein